MEVWAETNYSRTSSNGAPSVPGQEPTLNTFDFSITNEMLYVAHGGVAGGRGAEVILRYPSLKKQANHTHSMFILGIGLAPTNSVT
jgi:hypothetical protein